MCPRGQVGAGLAPAAGLIRSLSARGRDPSQSCRRGSYAPDRHRCPPSRGWRSGDAGRRGGLRDRRRHPPRSARAGGGARGHRRRRGPARSRPTAAATARRCGSPSGTLPAGGSGRWKAPAATAPGWRGSWPSTASGCWRSTVRPATISGRRPRATSSTRSARRARVLGRDRHAQPRAAACARRCGRSTTTRAGAIEARTAALNQLRALIVSAPEPLRDQLRGHRAHRCWRAACACARTPASRPSCAPPSWPCAAAPAASARSATRPSSSSARSPARRRHRTAAARRTRRRPDQRRADRALLVAPRPLRRESRFARLAGAAPIPASSGLQTHRYRLDRGGDRQLNRALHTIILSRRQRHAPTIAYLDRRRSEGKTTREAVRCLKRYLARHLWRLLEHAPTIT